jgi:cytochrome b subunit of formate dehydrogenase
VTLRLHASLLCLHLLALYRPAVADDALANDVCLACHGEAGFAAPSGESLAIDPNRFAGSVHGPLPCVVCHADITEIPHPEQLSTVGLDTCTACHGDAVEAYRAGAHARNHAAAGGEAPGCENCHGNIHAVLPHTDPASSAHWSHLADTCAQCHARIDLAKRFGIPVVQPVASFLDSVHARAIAAGKHGAECGDCHGVHDIRPSRDPTSPIARQNVPATCGRCHADVLAAYHSSVHGTALVRGVSDAPVCTTCHGEHRILGITDPTSPVFAANSPGETCGRCHGNERLNEKYGLTVGRVSAFRDSFHGLALRAGRPTVANCASCHGVHDILPSSDPRSRVNAANLAGTCGECHPGAGTYFAIGTVHGTADSTSTRAVGWVRFLYLWLIGPTVGFMLGHNLLDLVRKARHPHPPPEAPIAAPERMPRAVRWQHGLVMLSFTVLVYTGFALTYPESWWASPVLRWEEHFALRGILHRIAAVVLLVALGLHIGHLALSRRFRNCMRAIRPAPRDAANVLRALAYYLGLRPTPPAGGTFSYIEKLEYWAFMWGTAVMTLTGVVLWFENVSLRYAPTWFIDIATAIHFWEAVLATLSILIWHLYWVIFDPEVYPMDWSWWNGYSPASRVIERQEGDAADDSQSS